MKKLLLIFSLILVPQIFGKTFVVKTSDSEKGVSMTFSPLFLEIEVGDKVKFEPTDEGHTSKSLFVPEGAQAWEGKDSKEIIVEFNKPGYYLYDCANHGVMGMMGLVVVGEPKNKEKVKNFYVKHKKNVVMNKNRLDQYLIED